MVVCAALAIGVWMVGGAGAEPDPMASVREALRRGDRAAAVEALEEVASRPTEPDRVRATAWNNLCVLLAERGDGEGALAACDRALALRRQLLEALDAATTDAAADPSLAAAAEDAAARRRAAERRIARTLNNRGLALHALGRSPEAHAAFSEALAGSRAVGDVESEAVHRANLATTADALGRLGEAFAHYRAVEALARAHPDAPWAAEQRAVAWINQGATLETIGASDQALALYETLRDRLDELPPRHRGTFLLNLGVFYRNLGDPVQALDAFAAASDLFVAQGDRSGEVTARLSEGLTLEENLGRRDAARDVFEAALERAREIGDATGEMQALDLSARSRLRALERATDPVPDAAAIAVVAERFESALERARAAGSLEAEASALEGLARLALVNDDPDAAWRSGEAAVAVVERTRAGVDEVDLRRRFFTPRRPIYDTAIEAAWARGGGASEAAARDALAMALRAKARELAAGRETALDFEKTLAERIEQALADEVSTVEYWVGQRSVFAWVLGGSAADGRASSSPSFHRCGESATLLGRVERVHAALRGDRRPSEEDLSTLSEQLLDCVALDWFDDELPDAEAPDDELPEATANGAPRLRLATDRGLRFLPFEILPTRSRAADGEARSDVLLVDRADIVYLPSLAFASTPRGPRVRHFVGFADPRLEAAVDAGQNTASTAATPAIRDPSPGPSAAALLAARFALGPLDGARTEVARAAEGLGRRAPARATVSVVGDAADETTLRRLASEGTRVLHLATHTVLDDGTGSAAVLLAPSLRDDGLWRPEEIAALDLPIDLVVLASCSSATAGADASAGGGDALGSLSGAMLGAGVGGVVASLWDTGDQATAALMDGFYQRLAAGDEPTVALAGAKRTLRAAPGWDAPHLWSAFVLLGEAPAVAEARPRSGARLASVGAAIGLALVCIAAGLAAVSRRRRG